MHFGWIAMHFVEWWCTQLNHDALVEWSCTLLNCYALCWMLMHFGRWRSGRPKKAGRLVPRRSTCVLYCSGLQCGAVSCSVLQCVWCSAPNVNRVNWPCATMYVIDACHDAVCCCMLLCLWSLLFTYSVCVFWIEFGYKYEIFVACISLAHLCDECCMCWQWLCAHEVCKLVYMELWHGAWVVAGKFADGLLVVALQVCKMVFIGKNLDKDSLRKGLEAAKPWWMVNPVSLNSRVWPCVDVRNGLDPRSVTTHLHTATHSQHCNTLTALQHRG